MRGYDGQFTKVIIESSRYENGRLLVSGTGMAGERFRDFVYWEPHGFHARPADGSIGYLVAPGGRRDQGMVMAAANPSRVPALQKGEAAMYDAAGNVVTLTAAGWHFSMDVTIAGNLRVEGALHATGNITSDSPDAEDE